MGKCTVQRRGRKASVFLSKIYRFAKAGNVKTTYDKHVIQSPLGRNTLVKNILQYNTCKLQFLWWRDIFFCSYMWQYLFLIIQCFYLALVTFLSCEKTTLWASHPNVKNSYNFSLICKKEKKSIFLQILWMIKSFRQIFVLQQNGNSCTC